MACQQFRIPDSKFRLISFMAPLAMARHVPALFEAKSVEARQTLESKEQSSGWRRDTDGIAKVGSAALAGRLR